jgi:hypothetical protein
LSYLGVLFCGRKEDVLEHNEAAKNRVLAAISVEWKKSLKRHNSRSSKVLRTYRRAI